MLWINEGFVLDDAGNMLTSKPREGLQAGACA